MPGRAIPLATGEYYHLINRGADSRNIFIQRHDYKRFVKTLHYYHFQGPKPKLSKFSEMKFSIWEPKLEDKLVEVVAYCLMPNHIHILAKQLKESGISTFMSQLLNSYTRAFNTKYKRIGALFQGTFKSVLVQNDEQLLHLSRYIHINPIVSRLSRELLDYEWSSYAEYMRLRSGFCTPNKVMEFFDSPQSYDAFLKDQVNYGESLEFLKYHIADEVYESTFKVEG